jgi:hypothetical protein
MVVRKSEWRSFEDAVRYIVSQHRDFFGLESVEPQPATAIEKCGRSFDIEVIGYQEGTLKMVYFECRRKTTRNIAPDEAEALAYKIQQSDAGGGYFVTPLGTALSRGATLVANYEQIGHIQVSANATPEQYVMQCINQIFTMITTRVGVRTGGTYQVIGPDGKVKQQGQIRS